MSHTFYLKNVKFTDIPALRLAVAELQKAGVKCTLLQNKLARAYYASQSGMDKPANYVLNLQDGPYDVGFYEGDKKGSYEARFDNYRNSIGAIIGAKNKTTDQAPIGKLVQAYTVHATMRQAIREGNSVQRIQGEDGRQQLRIRVA